MKISVNQLQTCSINSEIYRESDVIDLVNSISEVGLLQPIVVTPENIIISGHRRFKAIQALAWTEVECEVKVIPHNEIDVHIVLYNQSRVKVATEMLREIKVLYQNLWTGTGNNYGCGTQPAAPCWLSEGQSHFAGLLVGASSFDKYLKIRKRQVNGHPVNSFKDYSSAGILDYYNKDIPYKCLPPNPNYRLGYTIGYLTVEALSAIGGSESSMNLYKRTGSGETFEQAFMHVYGISWNEAKPILAEVVASMFEILK